MSEPRFRRRPDALWRRSLDAVAVLPVDRAEPITLAGTGPEVWHLLADWRTLEELAAMLAAAHDVTPDTVVSDVAPVLDDLVAARAIDRDEGGSRGG